MPENNGRDDKGRFLPGTSGNPGGRPRTKIITDAIVAQLQHMSADELADLARRWIAAALEPTAAGAAWARFIADRVEGRVALQVDVADTTPRRVRLRFPWETESPDALD